MSLSLSPSLFLLHRCCLHALECPRVRADRDIETLCRRPTYLLPPYVNPVGPSIRTFNPQVAFANDYRLLETGSFAADHCMTQGR